MSWPRSSGTAARSSRSRAASRCSRTRCIPLMDRLLALGRTVMLETGGHRPIDRVPREVVKIVDVKCPGSGEAGQERLGEPRPARAARRGEVRHAGSSRLRVRARGDRAVRPGRARRRPCCCRPFTACSNRERSSEWMLADRVPARLQLQLHKYIWSPIDEGCVSLHAGRGPSERRARLVHRRGDCQVRGILAVRADHPLRSASRRRDRGGTPRGGALGVAAASRARRSTCGASADRR